MCALYCSYPPPPLVFRLSAYRPHLYILFIYTHNLWVFFLSSLLSTLRQSLFCLLRMQRAMELCEARAARAACHKIENCVTSKKASFVVDSFTIKT